MNSIFPCFQGSNNTMDHPINRSPTTTPSYLSRSEIAEIVVPTFSNEFVDKILGAETNTKVKEFNPNSQERRLKQSSLEEVT